MMLQLSRLSIRASTLLRLQCAAPTLASLGRTQSTSTVGPSHSLTLSLDAVSSRGGSRVALGCPYNSEQNGSDKQTQIRRRHDSADAASPRQAAVASPSAAPSTNESVSGRPSRSLRTRMPPRDSSEYTPDELHRLPLTVAIKDLARVWHHPDSSRCPGGAPPGNHADCHYVSRRFKFRNYTDAVDFVAKASRLVRTAKSKPALGLTLDPTLPAVLISIPTLVGLRKNVADSPMATSKAQLRLREVLYQLRQAEARSGVDTGIEAQAGAEAGAEVGAGVKSKAELVAERDTLAEFLRERYMPYGWEPVGARMDKQLSEAYGRMEHRAVSKKDMQRMLRQRSNLADEDSQGREPTQSKRGGSRFNTSSEGGADAAAAKEDIKDRVPVPVPSESEIKDQIDGTQPRGGGSGNGSGENPSSNHDDGKAVDEELEERVPFPVPSAEELESPPRPVDSERETPRTANRDTDEQSDAAVETDGRSIEERVPFPSATAAGEKERQ